MKWLWALTLVLSCTQNTPDPISETQGHQEPLTYPQFFLDDYVFSITTFKGTLKAFIAEGTIYSAQHGVSYGVDWGEDIRTMGTTTIRGLEICDDIDSHDQGDFLYYFTIDRGLIMASLHQKGFQEVDNVWIISTLPDIHAGDSGSPMMCIEHHSVVGIVTHRDFNETLDDVKNSGMIHILK